MDDRQIIEALSRDYSVGTEGFRERLLERCLSVVCGDEDPMVLDDDELDMLAAAGDPYQSQDDSRPGI